MAPVSQNETPSSDPPYGPRRIDLNLTSAAMPDLRRKLARWHRLTALFLSPVILALLVSGGILAFRPILAGPAPVTPTLDMARLLALLARVDSAGTARIVAISDDGRLAIVGKGREMPTAYDLATGAVSPMPPEAQPTFYDRVERVHRDLWWGLGGLVTLATFALLFQVAVGPFLAPLRAPRTLLTWHTALGWGLWPLTLVLPITAALIVLPIGRPFGMRRMPTESPPPIARSLEQAAALTDLSHLGAAQRLPEGSLFIVTEGPEGEARQMFHDGKVYRFGGGLVRTAHAIHTGEWGGIWGGVLDLAGATVLLTMLVTGLWSWWRRR